MPEKITKYNLLISCPGDVVEEIGIIENCVRKFNDQFSDTIGISIQTYHWSKSSYPQSGGKPQALLNEQLVNKCDAAIAVFWTRFGTETDTYGSGTEEEIEIVLQEGKQVFLYFSDIPAKLSGVDGKQYKAIQKMRKKYTDRGLYSTYDSIDQFEKALSSHLVYYFIPLRRIEEIQSGQLALYIQTISNGKKIDGIAISKFIQPEKTISKTINAEITELFRNLCNYKLSCCQTPVDTSIRNPYAERFDMNLLREPVTISDSKKEIIKLFAEKNGEHIDESFFGLGNLYIDKLATQISRISYGNTVYKGTDTEKQRYHDILLLSKKIYEYVSWIEFEEMYQKFYCVSFAISNAGTTFDEDIDIELMFDENDYIIHENLPIPNDGILKLLYDHEEIFSEMYSIAGTSEYENYNTSCIHPVQQNIHYPSTDEYHSIDYQKEYREALNDLFDYKRYQNSACIIIKLKVDYVKQHTSIAFPSKLFVRESLKRIAYKITSKHGPEIIEGTLTVRIE